MTIEIVAVKRGCSASRFFAETSDGKQLEIYYWHDALVARWGWTDCWNTDVVAYAEDVPHEMWGSYDYMRQRMAEHGIMIPDGLWTVMSKEEKEMRDDW